LLFGQRQAEGGRDEPQTASKPEGKMIAESDTPGFLRQSAARLRKIAAESEAALSPEMLKLAAEIEAYADRIERKGANAANAGDSA